MTKFTDLTREQMHLVNQAWYEANNAWARPAHDHTSPLDIIAELFQTAYDMGQKAPRPGDMVVAHFQENARSVNDRQLYSEYDRKLQSDIARLQCEQLPYCPHCKQRHENKDPCELVRALRRITEYAQEAARRALDTTQPLVIDEPERDDPHEDLGYRGRK